MHYSKKKKKNNQAENFKKMEPISEARGAPTIRACVINGRQGKSM